MAESEFSLLPAQISLLEMPQHKRKKMMALTTNVMRDESDKVKLIENLCAIEFFS